MVTFVGKIKFIPKKRPKSMGERLQYDDSQAAIS